MERVQMRALSRIIGEHDPERVDPGQLFTCWDNVALSLESRGLAERYRPSIIGKQCGEDLFAKMIARLQNKMYRPEHQAMTAENKAEPVADPSIIPPDDGVPVRRKRGWPLGKPRKPR